MEKGLPAVSGCGVGDSFITPSVGWALVPKAGEEIGIRGGHQAVGVDGVVDHVDTIRGVRVNRHFAPLRKLGVPCGVEDGLELGTIDRLFPRYVTT